MVVSSKGESIFLSHTRAQEVATQQHGYVVPMMGQDGNVVEAIVIPKQAPS